MRVQFTREVLVGPRSYKAGDVAEIPDPLARVHIKAKSAAVAVERAAASDAPETAAAAPGQRRKV